MKLFQHAVAACTAGIASPALACAMKPPPMPLTQLRQASDAIVVGRLEYGLRRFPGTSFAYTVGTVVPAKALKGPSKRFPISHEHMNTACQTWGWEPDRKPARTYSGTFYLFSNKDGTYSIARYSPKAER